MVECNRTINMAEKESDLDCSGLSRNVWLVKVRSQ